MVRSSVALVRALARYWLTIAPLVRVQIDRWEQCAQAIDDPGLRVVALGKLHDERFNSEVAALLASNVPRAYRASTVEAIVALEILYEYLDGLSESSPPQLALRDGRQLFTAFEDALTLSDEPCQDYYRYHPVSADGGYLSELVMAVRTALRRLPLTHAVVEVVKQSAERSAEAQIRIHARTLVDVTELEAWAKQQAQDTALGWREWLAGSAASVLAVHALIVAATDHRTTPQIAKEVDSAYLSICALSTALDSLIDYQEDLGRGEPGFVRLYEDHDHFARRLANLVETAAIQTRSLLDAPHHTMILGGVIAYYTSAPTAKTQLAQPVTSAVQQKLRPLITSSLLVMFTWRIAKRIHVWWSGQKQLRRSCS